MSTTKQEMILDAMSRLEGAWLEESLQERSRLLARAGRRIKPLTVKRLGALAACLAVVVTVGLSAKAIFTGHHEPAPHTEYFPSVADVETALDRELLLNTLEKDPSLSRTRDISLSFATAEDGATPSEPLMLKARYTATEADNSPETVDAVSHIDLYILFDRQSVDDSYIGGYEEQGLSKQYGEITVFYSLIEDPMMHGQAKFLYNGDLYVLDVSSTGDTHFLMRYLDMLLGSETAR